MDSGPGAMTTPTTQMRNLVKGSSVEADTIIEIRDGAFDALDKGFLREMTLAIYLVRVFEFRLMMVALICAGLCAGQGRPNKVRLSLTSCSFLSLLRWFAHSIIESYTFGISV